MTMTFHNNWATFQYSSNKTLRQNYFDECKLVVNQKAKETTTLGVAMSRAVCLLPDSVGVFYSGGFDSEIIVMEMLRHGITPKLYFIDFELNYHDKEYAEKFCNHNKLKLRTIPINIENFIKKDIYNYVPYGCNDLATPLNFHARTLIEDDVNIVAGVGDPPLFRTVSQIIPNLKQDWVISISENSEVARYFWYQKHFPKDVPLFYRYTAELSAAYITDSEIADIVLNERYKLSVKSTKHKVLSKFYDIENRTKYTGFENLNKDLKENILIELDRLVISKSIVMTYKEYVSMLL